MGTFPTGARGRSRVDPRNPVAAAVCDRCSTKYNHTDLAWQFEYAGVQLQNKRILVCPRCMDIPNPQLLSYNPGADPLPIRDPRPRLEFEGYPPEIVVTTNAFTVGRLLVDSHGAAIIDENGNAIGVGPASWGTLIGANPIRGRLSFTLPWSFGIWLNPTGGPVAPGWPGCVFYAPGTYYEAFGAASQPALTYFSTIAGLLIVLQSQ
jgi:hypothetical protein